ncbi:MAG: hypothetical protein AAF289_17815 [Cyanobacteria bacterium P01_A01_bin.135]
MTQTPLDAPFQRLRTLRTMLLRLHKALLNWERTFYEQEHGRIKNNGEFFRLVVGHEWFDWLRPMSQFIVRIDEALSAKEPATLSEVNQILGDARSLIKMDEEGSGPEQRYYEAIQRSPDIAYMHAEVSQLLQD